MTLRSSLYDDIYFSPEDGVAESQFVYIEGNHLPRRFRYMEHRPFVVAELGFGTGLNFLLTMRSFLAEAPAHAQLQYFSVEKHPLPTARIEEAFAPLGLGQSADELVDLLRSSAWTVPGFHTIFVHERVRLTIMVGEAETMLASLGGGAVDAWFADGFAPAKNPAMWTDNVFSHVGRLSKQGTTIATFSSAGAVRRSMEQAGFVVEKTPGFGSKREMVVGRFVGKIEEAVEERRDRPNNSDGLNSIDGYNNDECKKPSHAVIIGGGLAGLMASHALLRRGWTVELREKRQATGQASSGNPAGLFMPYLTAQPTTISRFTMRACETLISAFPAFGLSALLHRTGIVRRIGNSGAPPSLYAALQERIEKAIRSHALPKSYIRKIDKTHYLMRTAGWTQPAELCRSLTAALTSYGDRFRLTLNDACKALPDVAKRQADVVVVSAGTELASFPQTAFLPIKSVRGQLFLCETARMQRYLKSFARCRRPSAFENYFIPDPEGWVFGATFEPYSTREDRDPASDERLLSDIVEQFPEIGLAMQEDGFVPEHGRVGFRSQSKDYIPVIGPLPDYEEALPRLKADPAATIPLHKNVFVHGGFGSRGVMSSVLAAELLASHINEEIHPIEADLMTELLPHRFVRRDAKKQ